VDEHRVAKHLVLGVGLVAGIFCATVHADDCVRSRPRPIFPASRDDIQSHRFTIESDHEAVEQFRLDTLTQVKVEHGGCEYVVTKLRFESPTLFAKTYSDALAYETAVSLLRRLNDARPDSSFDLELASRTLMKEARKGRGGKIGRELAVQGDGVSPLQAVILIDAAGREQSRGFLAVTLFRGPL